ncbi:MAG: Gfo/Idh/MocA family oxidoreductase [Caldilineaceae bacterium]|nr:Gfo/Idh/MocA family oxidoreductase [Caldilineaceae bacterium]
MVTAVIVGAGHRALTYAAYAQHHPDELQIVGVADPIAPRRQLVAAQYHLPPERCFASAEELVAQPQLADFVINGTMDHQHVATSLPVLAAGYDLLLEKPFATNEAELWALADATQRYQRKVAICHVLRFAPFYRAIRQQVVNGVIGELLNVQAVEHVSYHHMAVGFVRGKWNSKTKCFSPMLMAKCCHDLDLIAWMKSGVAPVRVASFGSNYQFRPERAPAQAGTRCLVDCPIEVDCLYSARKHYIDHPNRWAFYVWDALQQAGTAARPTPPVKHYTELTLEEKIEWLKTDNPYGRCVWKCDNDVVDHQAVAIEFADGTTATLNMVGGAAKPSRSLHLIGTKGEIQGNLEDSRFVIRRIDPRPGCEYAEEVIDLNLGGDMTGAFGGHGGGDLRLMADFVQLVRGEQPSISTTTLADSINGHLIGFCADRAMEEGRVVAVPRGRG